MYLEAIAAAKCCLLPQHLAYLQVQEAVQEDGRRTYSYLSGPKYPTQRLSDLINETIPVGIHKAHKGILWAMRRLAFYGLEDKQTCG